MNTCIQIRVFGLLCCLLLTHWAFSQTTRYVSTTGITPAASAISWAASTTDLQGAINASQPGDQVWVAQGLYKPAQNQPFSMKDGVAIYGGFTGSEQSPENRPVVNPVIGRPSATTLAGNGSSVINNPASLSLTPAALLDGFVITGGRNVSLGGGMYNNGSSPTLINCSFLSNQANTGGGALYSENSIPTLINCNFLSNQANIGGGAIYFIDSRPVVTNCNFQNNLSQVGGAISNNSRFSLNRSTSNIALTNCSFQNNQASDSGGAIGVGSVTAIVTNCSFQNNQTSGSGGAVYGLDCNILFTNCILFGNNGSNTITSKTSTLTARYSLFESGVTGFISDPSNLTGITTSPFAGTATTQLAVNSVARDRGDLASYTAIGGGATDLAGNPRIVGTNYSIDMGAYEDQNGSPVSVQIVRHPPSASVVCAGVTVTVSVSATGSSLSYQWYRNGSPLTTNTSAASATLILSNVNTNDAGSYSVVVTGGLSVTSTTFRLTINPSPTRLYVAASQTANAGDGQSWATAFPDLQSALTYPCSQSLTEIWVAEGIYKPTNTTARDISFRMLPGVAIIGGFMGSETALSGRPAVNPITGNPSSSTLSGDIDNDGTLANNSYHIIYNPASLSLTNSAVLDGFVITGGNANASSSPNKEGGGIYNNGSSSVCSPSFRNCLLQGNSASSAGGAMFNYGTSSGLSSPGLTNCLLQGNSAQTGGAILNDGSGGLSSPGLTNCLLQGNLADIGGAIFNFGTNGISNPVLTSCLLQGNAAGLLGGAMYNQGSYGVSSPVLTNCSLQSNSAQTGGAMISNGDNGRSNPLLTSCILWSNGGSNSLMNSNASTQLRYSLYEPELVTTGVDITGPGNLTTTSSPFVSATSVALALCSPAINAGNPLSITVTDGPYSATALPATDLTGNARITGTRIDMGAIEYQSLSGVPLEIALQPVSGSAVCAGTTVVMSVSVTGSAPAYRWYRSGTALTGIASATTASLTLTNVRTTDAGSYSVVISGDCPSVTSTAFSLSVNALPSVTVTAAPSTTLSCTNRSLTLTAQTSATAFAWSSGSSTGQTLPVSQTGVYSVTVTDGNGCSAVSNSLTIVRDNTSPAVSVSALSTTLTCSQPTLTLTATASVTALLWSTGQTTTTISVSQTGSYSVTATGANGCTAVSNSLLISEDFSLPLFTISSATVCPGQSVNLTAGGCSGQILWSTGATTAMLTLTAGISTSLLTATCTVGICSATAAGQVVVGGIQPPPAQILSFTADESACPVRLTGRGVASSFTMTGPGSYVFSTVYREGTTHEAIGLNVKQAGTYTLTATYSNSCGTSAPVTRTVSVGRNCP